MALNHFSARVVSRGKNQSLAAKAAYNGRAQLYDLETATRTPSGKVNLGTAEIKDYSGHGSPAVVSRILAPKDPNLPRWARGQSRQKLIDQIIAREKQKNSQMVREVVISLPHELTEAQRHNLIFDFVNKNFVSMGMIAIVDIHPPDKDGDPRNHHAHVLLTMRKVGPKGFGLKVREWNTVDQLNEWRAAWSAFGAERLEETGFKKQADRFRHGHLTIEKQRQAAVDRGDNAWAKALNRPPQKYKGPTRTHLERKAKKADAPVFTARQIKIREEAKKLERDFRTMAQNLTLPMFPESVALQPEPRYHTARRQILGDLVNDNPEAFNQAGGKPKTLEPYVDFSAAAEKLMEEGVGRSWRSKKPPPAVPVTPPVPKLLFEGVFSPVKLKKPPAIKQVVATKEVPSPREIVVDLAIPQELFDPRKQIAGAKQAPLGLVMTEFAREISRRGQSATLVPEKTDDGGLMHVRLSSVSNANVNDEITKLTEKWAALAKRTTGRLVASDVEMPVQLSSLNVVAKAKPIKLVATKNPPTQEVMVDLDVPRELLDPNNHIPNATKRSPLSGVLIDFGREMFARKGQKATLVVAEGTGRVSVRTTMSTSGADKGDQIDALRTKWMALGKRMLSRLAA